MTPHLDCKLGDRVRVRRGWNPMAPVRTVTDIDIITGNVTLDCTCDNGVFINEMNAGIWEKVRNDATS